MITGRQSARQERGTRLKLPNVLNTLLVLVRLGNQELFTDYVGPE